MQIMSIIRKNKQDLNKTRCCNILKPKYSEEMRHSAQKLNFIKRKRCFDLKVALFAEKEKNKFAYEFKSNKFVFNNVIYV
jgi:hypothetical protein